MQLYQQYPSNPVHPYPEYATPVIGVPRQVPQLALALVPQPNDLRRVVPVIWSDAQQPQMQNINAAISTSVPDVRRVFYSGYL